MGIENIEPDYETGGVLKKQLDADDVVQYLMANLKGDYYDAIEGQYIKGRGKAYLNESGIVAIISILKGRISNNFQYSTLSSEQIRNIRMACIRDVWRNLVYNKETYKLNITDISIILNMVDDALLLFLSRTEKGGFRNFIGGLFKSSETYTEKIDEEPKNNNIFGRN